MNIFLFNRTGDTSTWRVALRLELITALVVLLFGPSLFEFVVLMLPVFVASELWIRDEGFDRFHLVFIPAMLLFPTVLRDIEFASSGLRPEHMLFLWAFGALISGIALGRKVVIPKTFGVLLLAWVLTAVATSTLQLINDWSFRNMVAAVISMQGMTRPLLILAIFYSIGSNKFFLRSVFSTLVLVGGLVSVFMLMQFLEVPLVTDITVEYFDRNNVRLTGIDGGRGDVVGTFDGQHNKAGLFSVFWITATTMFGMALWLRGRMEWSVVTAILVLVGYVGLFGTFSRTGFVAAVVAFTVLMGINFRYNPKRTLIGVSVIIIAVLIAALAAELYGGYVSYRIGGELLDSSYALNDPRVTISYPELMSLWQKSPIYGNGYNLGTAADIGYLSELASRGVIGLSILLLLWIYIIWNGWKGTRSNDVFISGASASVIASTLAFSVAMVAIHPFLQARVIDVYWVLVTLTVASVNTRVFNIGLPTGIFSRRSSRLVH